MKPLRFGHAVWISNKDPLTQRAAPSRWSGLTGRSVVRVALNLWCWMTGHAGGCWLLNDCPGVSRLWRWSVAPKVNGMCATTAAMGGYRSAWEGE